MTVYDGVDEAVDEVSLLRRQRDDARAELANQWRTFRQALDVSKDLAKYCNDYRAERDRAEELVVELRDLVVELRDRVLELVEEAGEQRADADGLALQRRADEAEIDRLQSRLRDAEVAMAGMVAELGERRAS